MKRESVHTSRIRGAPPVGLLVVAGLALAGISATCSGGGGARKPLAVVSILYTTNLSGAFEPCGCEPGMLGGIDRMLTVAAEASASSAGKVLVAAGEHAVRGGEDDRRTAIRADLVSDVFRAGGVVAVGPGVAELSHLARRVGAREPLPYLASNVTGVPHLVAGGVHVASTAGAQIGFVGAVFPAEEIEPPLPPSVSIADPTAAVRAGVAQVRSKGAQIVVVLLDGDLLQARRLAAAVTGIDFIIAGRSERALAFAEAVEGTTTWIVQAGRDGEYVGVIDLHLRDGGLEGSKLVDGDDSARAVISLEKLRERIREIEARMAAAAASGAPTGDLGPLLERKRAEEKALLARVTAGKKPPDGPYFRHRLLPVRDDITGHAAARSRIEEYNLALAKLDYEEEEPVPEPEAGKAGYIGAERCGECHESEYDVWKTTKHAAAMVVLAEMKRDKVAECVSCHVSGFRKPGGSSLHDLKGLAGVQCESCHGPGSLHEAADGLDSPATVKRTTTAAECTAYCHHPPHDSDFDYHAMLVKGVLQPGHGDEMLDKIRKREGKGAPETAAPSAPTGH